MDFTSIDITERVFLFFETNKNYDFLIINKKLENITGIINFFKEENEVKQLYNRIESHCLELMERQEEYGDYQTNENLSLSICHRLKDKNIDPQIIIEPTCGKGNFILSSLRVFNNIEKIFAIEIQEHYLWTLKFRLIDFFIENPSLNRPQIYISNISVFDYDFSQIKNKIKDEKLLILGNPPWVTNSALSILNSTNLPRKYNIKRTKGIEAITGKSNFDIGEYIILNLLDLFSIYYGHFAFLIKNSVIKNIIYDQKINNYQIGKIEKYSIDSMKEFGASVDSSLFLCEMHNSPDYFANEGNFYDFKITNTLGWVDGKFASNITKYKKYNKSDGISPFEWRQGMKHDCAKVMEFEKNNGIFVNSLGETFELEDDLVYGLLKSSDLKNDIVNNVRKYTIVTQKYVGQDIMPVLDNLPKTKEYLINHKEFFLKRKSRIYNGKSIFSIFGIGDYSFKRYKVAISGLYKQTKFSLVYPIEKEIMLDDTCYFIGFNNREDALITQYLLNMGETQEFINSLIFFDSKRIITKELLMRIDLREIVKKVNYIDIKDIVSLENWEKYIFSYFSNTEYSLF